MAADDAWVTTRFAHAPERATWSYEATAPASDLSDQYRARTRNGVMTLSLLRLSAKFLVFTGCLKN